MTNPNVLIAKRGDGGDAFNIYTSEAPGLKISPKTVLITSLVYVGIVVFLHIW